MNINALKKLCFLTENAYVIWQAVETYWKQEKIRELIFGFLKWENRTFPFDYFRGHNSSVYAIKWSFQIPFSNPA